MPAAPLLEIQDVSKAFAGTQALSRVSFILDAGEVHALVGENGAGKSTLMNIVAGVLQPDEGSIRVAGEAVTIDTPRRAQALGIGIVFQELSLVESLSVAENIFVNRVPTRGGLVDWRRLEERTRAILAPFGLDVDPWAAVADLPLSQRQLVEFAKALSLDVRVLILDEPTSALPPDEVEALFAVIRQLRAQGIGVIYISHQLAEIFAIADRVTVLRDGHVISTRSISACDMDGIIRAMVGRDIEAVPTRSRTDTGAALLEARGLARTNVFETVDLTLRAGEIVGLAGLMGAHRSELGRALAGALRATSGEIRVGSEPVRLTDVRTALRHGIAYLTDERKSDGLFLEMSIADNIIAPALHRFSRFGLVEAHSALNVAQERMTRLRIKAAGAHQAVGQLSGGNQQKVLLAKMLESAPRVLVIDEPSKGVDVGTKQEIHALLRELADAGAALLVISSDLPELLALCDRILVMREGQIAGALDRSEATEETILAMATGSPPVNASERLHEPHA
ncbi:sugar ABC transporter ATP-binding protein [Inquilinus limosus]|uniref:sugar ABC transporter ATP-binding protein n=1 Tax=Inquilinus limosus TaxID=171674 RepID=UPI003F16D50F